MPIKSSPQFKLMQASAKGAGYGPSPNVAKEFLNKTSMKKKKLFASTPRPKNLKSKTRTVENG